MTDPLLTLGARGSLAGAPSTLPPLGVEYHGSADVPAAAAKMRPVQPAESVNSVLCCNLHASVKIRVAISAQDVLSASDFRKSLFESANREMPCPRRKPLSWITSGASRHRG